MKDVTNSGNRLYLPNLLCALCVFACALIIPACSRGIVGEYYSLDKEEPGKIIFHRDGTFEVYEGSTLGAIGTFEQEGNVIYLTVGDEATKAIFANQKLAVEPPGKKQQIFVARKLWDAEHQPAEDG